MKGRSYYLSEETIAEMDREAKRLERTLSWVAQQAWIIARERIISASGKYTKDANDLTLPLDDTI